MKDRTLVVNEIIVYFTFAVIVAAILSCIGMFSMRAVRQNKAISSNHAEKHSSRKDGSKHSSGLKRSKSEEKDKKKGKKRKTKRSRRGEPGEDSTATGDDNSSGSEYGSGSIGTSDSSSLLGDSKFDSHGKKVNDHLDKTLRETFLSVVRDGILITRHDPPNKPQHVRLQLVGHNLHITAHNNRFLSKSKPFVLPLKDIMFVEGGKRTISFSKSSNSSVKEELCFSLVTEEETFDFEASSKVERDALVQGFMLQIADEKDGCGYNNV